MFAQLQKMQQISQQSDEQLSSSQYQTNESLPLSIPPQCKSNLKLYKIGTKQQQQYEHQLELEIQERKFEKRVKNGEIDLDQYMDMQRGSLGNKGKQKEKKRVKTAQEIQMEKEFKEGYGKGFKMLEKMGFNVGKGLGKNQQGRTNIVQAQFKTALNTRDEDVQPEPQQSSKPEPPKQNPFNPDQYIQLFQYKSRLPHIATLLLTLKTKFQHFQSRSQHIQLEIDGKKRQILLSQSLRVQKQAELKAMDGEIQALEALEKGTRKIGENMGNGAIGLEYKIDLVVVKSAMDRLGQVQFKDMVPVLRKQIENARRVLSEIYLDKQRQALNKYRQTTGIQVKLKKYRQLKTKAKPSNIYETENDNDNNVKQQQKMEQQQVINLDSDEYMPQRKQVVTLPQTQIAKISNYLRTIVQQCVVKNKLQVTLQRQRSRKNYSILSDQSILSLFDIIRSCSQQLCTELLSTHILPLISSFMSTYSYSQSSRKPHLAIFPWLLHIPISQLPIYTFFQSLFSTLFPITTMQLYDLIYPWLRHIEKKDREYFQNFYLGPRLMREMDGFGFEGGEDGVKAKVKGFFKYCEMLGMEMRVQIVENTIGVAILSKYRKELERVQRQRGKMGENNCEKQFQDLKIWVRKWSEKIDMICPGTMKKMFQQNQIKQIW